MKIVRFGTEGPKDAAADDLASLLQDSSQVIWVDMEGPTEEDVRTMRDIFKFHPLAIEDTVNQRQRPKVDEYQDYLFIIVNPSAGNLADPGFRELDVFVGGNYVVTVHPKSEPVLDEVRKRIGRTASAGGITPGYLLYAIVDVVVDGYFPILDRLGEDVEELGDVIVTRENRQALTELFKLRRILLELWRVVSPQRDMFNVLTRRDLPYLDQKTLQYYLRDVYDHLLRISDMIDNFRDILTTTMDLYMSSVSNRLNQVVNRLTVFTVILGLMAALSGFYGMNFQTTWPPFSNPWGTPFVLAVMGSVTVMLVIAFRKLKWI